MAVKPKKKGIGLQIKTYSGKDGNSYLVFRTVPGSFHVFMEVEAKEAARQCGCVIKGDTRKMWASLWDHPAGDP